MFTTVWLGSNPGRGEKSCTTGKSHWSHPVCHDDWRGKAAVCHLYCGRREHVCSGVIHFVNICMSYYFSNLKDWWISSILNINVKEHCRAWSIVQQEGWTATMSLSYIFGVREKYVYDMVFCECNSQKNIWQVLLVLFCPRYRRSWQEK